MRIAARPATRAAVLALVLATAAGFPIARAEEAHLYVAPHAWFPDLSGDGEAAGGVFDVADDLEADGRDLHLGFDALARLGKHRIVVGFSDGEHEGDAGIDPKISLQRARAFYGYSFLNFSLVDVGFLIGADTYDLKTETDGGDISLDSPAPALGFMIGIRPPVVPLRVYAEAVYSSLEISDVDTTLTDAYVSLDWYLIPVAKLFGLQFGYRYYDLEAEDTKTNERMNYKFQGPFAGLVFRF